MRNWYAVEVWSGVLLASPLNSLTSFPQAIPLYACLDFDRVQRANVNIVMQSSVWPLVVLPGIWDVLPQDLRVSSTLTLCSKPDHRHT